MCNYLDFQVHLNLLMRALKLLSVLLTWPVTNCIILTDSCSCTERLQGWPVWWDRHSCWHWGERGRSCQNSISDGPVWCTLSRVPFFTVWRWVLLSCHVLTMPRSLYWAEGCLQPELLQGRTRRIQTWLNGGSNFDFSEGCMQLVQNQDN